MPHENLLRLYVAFKNVVKIKNVSETHTFPLKRFCLPTSVMAIELVEAIEAAFSANIAVASNTWGSFPQILENN